MNLRNIVICALFLPLLTACVAVDVKQDTVVRTNRTIIARIGAPADQARIGAGYRFKAVPLAAPFGKLHTVLVTSDPKKPLIVACGGNSFVETTSGAKVVEGLSPFGDVFLFDYPGLGRSQGKGLKKEYLSAIPLLDRKVAQIIASRAPGSPLIFWGHSLGAGYCAALAAAMPAKSVLVMEGAFANYQDIADAKTGAAAPFVHIKVEDDALQLDIPKILAHYNNPIVVIASENDETIPFSASNRLVLRLEKENKKIKFIVLSGVSHDNMRKSKDYASSISQYLSSILSIK